MTSLKEESETTADVEHLTNAMFESNEHLKNGNYFQAYDALRDVLQSLPSTNIPTVKTLTFYKSNFETLKNLKDPSLKRLAVEEAEEIVKYDPSYLPAHEYLFQHYSLIDKIPFRTLHYNYKRDLYDFSAIQRNICYNTMLSLENIKENENACFDMLLQACDMIVKSERLDLIMVKQGLEMIKFALQMDVEPIALFAYSALLVCTPDYDKGPDPHIPFNYVGTTEKALEENVKMLANQEITPADFCDCDTFAQNNQIGYFQFIMGYLYETGTHVKQNLLEAKTWYKKSAQVHGNKFAAFHLGFLYYEGFESIPKNLLMAKLYWQLAATEGLPEAMVMLGILNLQQLEVNAGFRLIDSCIENGSLAKYKEWFEESFQAASEKLGSHFSHLNKLLENYERHLGINGKGLAILQRVRRAELFKCDLTHAHLLNKMFHSVYKFSQCDYLHVPNESEQIAVQYLFSKLYLLSPLRVYSITNVRYQFVAQKQRNPLYNNEGYPVIKYKTQEWKQFANEYKTCLEEKLSLEMCYHPMMATSNYKYSCLHLTVASEIYEEKLNKTATFVAEDHTGNVINVLMEDGLTVLRLQDEYKLEFGSTFMVVHPGFYYEKFTHNYHRHLILGGVNDLSQIYLTGKVPDMCRFCGQARAKTLCDKCNYKYCGESCRKKDVKFLKHEYVCGNI